MNNWTEFTQALESNWGIFKQRLWIRVGQLWELCHRPRNASTWNHEWSK